MTFKLFFCVVTLVSCLAASEIEPAHAQTAPEPKPNPVLNRKAQALLMDTVNLARQLKNKENQVLSRIAVAELQWNDQEKSARQLYLEAFEVVRKAWTSLDPADEDATYNENAIIQLRDRVIASVAQHDPAMARQLFEQMRVAGQRDITDPAKEVNAGASQNDRADYDKTLETTIAVTAPAVNPDEQAGLIRKRLDEGSFSQAVLLMNHLAERDPQKAGSLMGDVVDKFRKADYASDPATIEVALFLLSQAFADLPKHKKELEERGQKGFVPLTPELSRQIVEVVTDAALDPKPNRTGAYLLSSLRGAIEDISEIDPAQADRLRKRFTEQEKQVGADPYSRFQELAAKKDLAVILEAARNAPAAMRDGFYGEAATAAWEQGDRAQAKEIVEKNIRSGFERNRLLRTFRENAIAESIKSGDLIQARQLIQQTRSTESRADQLIDLAGAYVLKHDNKAALEVLAEAQTLVPGKPANQTQLDLEIKLAKAFAAVDLDRSFALTSAAIDQINDLANAAARVSAFMGAMPTIKDGEFELQSYGIAGLGTVLSADLRPLFEADFERTRKIFDRFERPELRVSAYLFLARMILAPEQDCTCSCPDPAASRAKPAPKN